MQMEPLPIPTLSPSTPASIRFLAWAAVTTAEGGWHWANSSNTYYSYWLKTWQLISSGMQIWFRRSRSDLHAPVFPECMTLRKLYRVRLKCKHTTPLQIKMTYHYLQWPAGLDTFLWYIGSCWSGRWSCPETSPGGTEGSHGIIYNIKSVWLCTLRCW